MNMVPLRQVAVVTMGTAPPGATYNDIEEGFPMIAGAGDYGEIYPQPKKWTTQPTRTARTGDLIVCVRATIGDLNWADREYCLGRGVAGLRPRNGELDIKYLAHFISTKKAELAKLGTGSTFLAIRRGDLETFAIPLPPLAEQRRIAGVLDAADALRAKRRQALAQLDTLLQSTFLDMFGDPVMNPKGWEVQPLGKLLEDADVFTDGDWVESKDQNPLGEVRLTQLADVGIGSWANKSSRYLTSEKAKTLRCTFLAKDDVLVARMPDPIGRACLFPGDDNPCVTVVDVCIIRPRFNTLLPHYLIGLLNSEAGKNKILRLATGTTRQRISRGNLAKIKAINPPLDLQHRFAAIVESVEQQKSQHRAHLAELDTLFASLQSRAFSGEL